MNICPACGNRGRSVLKDAPFLLCRKCGIVYNLGYRTVKYSDSYFTEEYRAQYGKTYEEDKSAIRKSSISRMRLVLSLWNKYHGVSPHSLLDIGCALGFSLEVARGMGFTLTEGIELSKYASDYIQTKYGFSVLNESFETADIHRTYDVITAWYFIEHCKNTSEVIAKIATRLNKGGIFAFSVPSINGPMFRFHREKWVETHPIDHRADFSPAGIKKLLRTFGFTAIMIKSAGVHPERMFSKTNIFYPLLSALYTRISRRFIFSDTMEVYAVYGGK